MAGGVLYEAITGKKGEAPLEFTGAGNTPVQVAHKQARKPALVLAIPIGVDDGSGNIAEPTTPLANDATWNEAVSNNIHVVMYGTNLRRYRIICIPGDVA